MDFERAFDTLGLAVGSSEQEIESAYRRLSDHFDARIGRVTSLALRDRYADARAELEGARAVALQAAKLGRQPQAAGEGPARAWAVLGLAVGASPLEVASAYVSLCEELDRELAAAPTEAVRHRCLEARAEIDSAYQHCAAAPLAAEAAGATHATAGYETQVARATFEAPHAEPAPPDPVLVRILDDPDPLPPARSRRPRRRPLRRFVSATALLLFAAASSLGYVWWTDPELAHYLARYLPLPPDPQLVEAQTGAEYLRRRVDEERNDIQRRAEEASERVARLQSETAAGGTPDPHARGDDTLEQAQARSALAKHLLELTERHIFSSSALAEAYGHMELAGELASGGQTDRAVAAYAEARTNLEATLARLDEAEAAVGARYEAVDARDAWVALASSAGLEPGNAVTLGGERLDAADGLLESGQFAAAIPELRQASQSFRTAIEDGRHELAARRAAFEAAHKAEPSRADAQRVARAATDAAAPESDSLPPVSAGSRADAELVTVPGGGFVYGCDADAGRCSPSEPASGHAELDAFRIDRTEVRVSEYRRCVDGGACAPPAVASGCNWNAPGRGDHPVNCVDWDQAATYCGWVGKRLPTEQEWEKAARGTDGRTYPWGNDGPSCDVAVMSAAGGKGCGGASTAPVASRDRGRSPYGLFDMAGNVDEWTGSLYDSGSGARVLRGGSWKNDASAIRSFRRQGALPNLRDSSVGFRCAEGAIVAGVTD
jgi:formylglycine-generating enzyme required for sulfatase activity